MAGELAIDPPLPGIVGDPIVLAGRQADPARPDETEINEEMAEALAVWVGDTITVTPLTTAQLGELEAGVELDAAGTPTEVRVVGVTRAPIDVLPPRGQQQGYDNATFRLMPAWYRQHGPDLAAYGVMLGIDLAEGPGAIDGVAEALAAEYGERSLVVPGVEFDLGVTDEMQRAVEDRLRAEGRAQLAFAAVAALVAVVIFGQTLARQIATESSDVEALAALGLTRGDRTLAAILRSASVALGGGLLAVALAVGLSGFLPRGVGGRVQRHSGLAVDGWVLGLGFLAVGGVVLALAAVSAWRVGAVRHRSPSRRVAVADRFASAGAGVVTTLGMRMAFDRSRAARAGQLSIAACTMAVASVVAAGVVLSSYDALVHEPERFGQRWDLSFGDFSTRASMDEAVALLEARGDVASAVGELSDAGTARDLSVTVVAYLPGIGRMEPTVASGRVPIGPDEVLLGETAARALGVEIGDEIPLTIDFVGSTQSVTVVGFGVAGTALADPHPGRVAYVTPEAFEGAVELAPQVLLVELEPDADVEAATAALEDAYPDTVVGASSVPRSVLLWDELSYAPGALAVAVLVLAAVALVNALVTSVRRRRRELAVLKAAGRPPSADPRRWWHGRPTAWALVAVLIGAARWGWSSARAVGRRSPRSLGPPQPHRGAGAVRRGGRSVDRRHRQRRGAPHRVGRPRRSPPPSALRIE